MSIKEEIINRTYKKKNKTLYDQIIDGSYKSKINQELEKNESESQNINLPNNSAQAKTTAISLPINKTVSNLPIVKDLNNTKMAQENNLPILPVNTQPQKSSRTVTDVAKEFLDTTGKSAKTILTGINYLGQGIMKGTEGLTDTAIDVATSNVNPYYWFNQEKLENHQNIAQELIKKDATGDLITKLSGDEDFNKNFLDKDSLIKEDNLAGKVITSVGQMLPSIATGNPTAATTILGLQSYGGGVEEAYNNGANTTQARLYGLGNAAIELGTEKLFGGIPGTKTSGWLDNLVARGLGEKSFEEVSKSISKEIIKAGYKMVGEAGEEALAEIINPILKNATYSEGEKINWNNVLESAVVGGITGGILEAPSNIRNVNTAINNKNKVNLSTVDSTTSQNVNLPPVNNVETNLSSMKNENINLPTVKYRPETSDNSKINNLRQSAANYFDNSQKTHDLVSTIEKVIADKDYNVVFDNTITNKKGESVNAQITNNNGQIEIKINPNSPRTCEFLLCHEITHAIEINSMKQLVIDYASKHSDFNESLESLKQSYGTNEVTDEVLADISGQLFGNQEFINNLSMKQPNVFKRIYNKIVELANKITGNSKESLFIKDLKNKWETAYRNTSLEESVNNLNDSTKYMMTSVKGMQNGLNTNNRYQDIKNKYDRAIQLESSGQYDNEAIRQETGWFKDKEGNWEFEISDQYTKFKIQPKDNTKYKLSDIFEANTLYEMYPELKDITVSFKDMKGNGKYFAVTNGISINNKLINNLDSMRGTLLHEIQHYIQKVEGLPEGTTLFFGNEQYANSKGEIEAADTKNRRNLTVEQRKSIIPESSKENPIHPNRQSILNHKRNFVEKIGDKIYNKFGDNSNEISEEFYQENQKENIEIDSSSNRNGLEELDNSSFSVNKNGELQDNEGKKVKLETSETGTHGTLMAIHNLSTEKLRGILELGGFPVPSIAITNPDKVNHKQFGEISVLFDKNTINPSDKLNEVYDRDVWSPTFPTIDSEINKENLESVADEIGIKDYYLEDIAERNSNIEDLIYQVKKHDEVVRKFLDNNNIKYDADIDTYKELRNLATDNGLDTYLRKQLSNILGEKGIYNGKEYLTPSGNRRTFWQLHDKYTLENLVKNLTKGKTTGTQQVLFGAGFGPTSANMNNQFKSIEDIKNAENRIVSSEEQQKQQIGYIANLENAMKPLRQYAVEGIYTSGSEQVYNVIQELSEQKKVNVTNLIKILSEHGFNNVDTISQETLQNVITSLNDLKNMPTDYFEAKPQRAVGLNEVQAIIIPNTTDTEFKRQLQEFGLNYYEYDSNIEGDRQRVINQFDNLKFSQQNDKWQEYVEENYKATGTRTKFEDIKIPIAKENKINLPPVQTTNEVVENDKKIMNPNEISKLSIEDAITTPNLPLTNRNNVLATEQSSFYKNATKTSEFLTEESRNILSGENDIKYYEGITNKDTLGKAKERLDNGGASETFNWFNKDSKKATAIDVAEGWILMKQYQDNGDYNSMVEVAKKMREIGTQAGQTVQAFNIMERLTPEGMVKYAQSELSEAFENMSKNKTKQWIDSNREAFDLTPQEVQFIIDTMNEVQQMEDGYDKRVKLSEIQKMMTDKLPPSKGAGIKAWMRISMLFNPKTQVRNVLGNAIIAPVNTFSDLFASGVDRIISKKTGVRTTGTTDIKSYLKGFKKGAYESYNDFKKGINTRNMEGNRFEVSEGRSFNNNSVMGKALNRVDNLLGFMLDAGDRTFYEATFTNSINNQLILNNTDVVTQEMIDIATQEALSRTWQDNNNYTKFVLNVRKMMNNLNIKGYGLGDVLIPFAKTPANLTKAIIDYSPAGLIKTINEGVNLKRGLTNGQYTAKMQHDFVQDLGKATAGTMLYVLGYALAKAGITSGESDDDKDVANFMKNTLGVSSYSIKIGDKTFTYDWAQPIAAPLSITANIVNKQKENASLTENVISSLDTAGNILLEQSFLDSLNTVLSNNDGIATGIQEAIMELPSRAVPTLMKQITDMIDGTQRTTFEKDKPLETAKNKVLAKIPFASTTLAPTVDTMGREIQKYGGKNNIFNVFLNPANVNTENISEAAAEIYKVYQATGETSVMPRVPEYSYKDKDGNTIVITSEQRADYQKVSGKIIEDEVNKLLKTSEYKSMNNEEKADVLNDIVNYSYNIAKNQVLGLDISQTYQKAYDYSQIGNISDYYTFKNSIDTSNSDSKKESVSNYLISSKLNDEQLAFLYGTYYSSEKTLNNIINSQISMKEFIKYNSQTFETKYDSNGKAITNSRKSSVINYVNSLNLTVPQKAILIKMEYASYDKYDKQVVEYINNKKLSIIDKGTILKSIGIDSFDKQLINYVNSQKLTVSEKTKMLEDMGFTVRNGKVIA